MRFIDEPFDEEERQLMQIVEDGNTMPAPSSMKSEVLSLLKNESSKCIAKNVQAYEMSTN